MLLVLPLAAHDYYLMQLPPIHLLSSPRVDQCPIYSPSTCTMGLDLCDRHSIFGHTDPYYTLSGFYIGRSRSRQDSKRNAPPHFNPTKALRALKPYLTLQQSTLPMAMHEDYTQMMSLSISSTCGSVVILLWRGGGGGGGALREPTLFLHVIWQSYGLNVPPIMTEIILK